MDTKPLESFAKAARRELITAVSAQASAVLAPGSVARTERAETVRRLETEIAAHSHKHVIDKVAYTWFNRLIALRFMDAKGYTGAGIVSPAQGQAHGQPEILADAKRGDIDPDVVTSSSTRGAILGLLDGARRSTDAEGEAYALLLTEYCRFWHKSMPFMFEREGDYTELLVPAGLLADGGIVARARNVLTEEACDDVEVIGWLYQFYISERKSEVFAGFKKNKKAGADEIPAATQLFTPDWIVRYLIENSVGRLWMLNRPASRLVDRMNYYIAPVDEETDFLKLSGPEELTVIDPACGSGHMLTYAFDLLYAIYEEEGYAPAEIPSSILTHNVHGTEIDPRAGALAAFALAMKARTKDRRFFARDVKPNICVIEPISFAPDELDFLVTKSSARVAQENFWNQFRDADVLGSLIRPDADLTADAAALLPNLEDGLFQSGTLDRARQAVRQATALQRKYSVVTANPPYMGSKNMDARLTAFARAEFKESKSDLFAMFIQRCLALTTLHGATAMITMQSWMFGSSFGGLRDNMLRNSAIRTMVHLGTGAFDTISGEVVSTTAFTLEAVATRSERQGLFIDITRPSSEAAKSAALRSKVSGVGLTRSVLMSSFADIPGSPIAYWVSSDALAAFRSYPAISGVADLRAGISTGDNSQFERLWFEVSKSHISELGADTSVGNGRWTPCSSGGRFRRWYGNNEVLMDWQDGGARIRAHKGSAVRNSAYMGRAGLTYSKIGGARFAVRSLPPGHVFDDTGRMIFPSPGTRQQLLASLLNSSTAQHFLDLMSPGLTFTSNEIGQIPWAMKSDDSLLSRVDMAERISKDDWDSIEISWDYQRNPLIRNDGRRSVLLHEEVRRFSAVAAGSSSRLRDLEVENNRVVADAYGLQGVVSNGVDLQSVSLSRNVEYQYGAGRSATEYAELERADLVKELISYGVGCMFGRYSLDVPGLILADQGATLRHYLTRVPAPTFAPDVDNVIPFVDDGWFEDDIVERFRQFLRTAFGGEHFEENRRFVEDSLGVETLRDYFVTKSGKSKFYDDHVQRYKKRPIYWMFSSPKGSFNALIYLHRYTASTVSTVLNEYLREYEAKLTVALQQAESSAVTGSAKDQKEADRLRRVLAELRDYEHDVLYPLATQQISIDLDDGVKVNYPKFYPAVKKIFGLEASDE
ncbi:BREX-1 system adenine-specific DNA-methyltransferase PglX [Plantibacter sp. 2H11-2]|uniref:BREX-1 system adenine-specific DNA-methyltransferase PglX n=1 Tax=Plantibacter sp. 2H11-2 TaxID=3414431 RepID=UPI003CF0BE9E